jgi:hypothetical protein
VIFLLLPLTGNDVIEQNQKSTSDYYLSQIGTSTIDYLIITSEDFESAAEPLATWKTQRGLVSTIETVEDISENYEGADLAEKIRNCIIDYHDNHDTLWVVLAGGEYIVPTRTVEMNGGRVCSDSYYSILNDNWNVGFDGVATLLDADDWEAEVYVGRLPADSISQLIDLVSQLIDYEKNPPIGPWMKHAVFAGTFCNFDTDLNGNNIFDEGDRGEFDTNRNHNWIKSNLLPDGWTSTLLAECEGLKITEYPYDLPLNESSLVTQINAGASIVMADAHGSQYGMYRTMFTHDADSDVLFDSGVDDLSSVCFLDSFTDFDTEGKLGMYFLAACSTGTFVGHNCLTEYIVRNNGIGCIGSSGGAGYDPNWYDGDHLGWLTQGLSERFWNQLLAQGNNHPGMALALAKHDYGVDRVAMSGDADGGRTLAQFNLMGDPEVPIWIDVPSLFEAPVEEFEVSSRNLFIDVSDVSTDVSDIILTLQGSNYYHREIITDATDYQFPLPDSAEPGNITITLSRSGYIPLQIVIEIPSGTRDVGYVPIAAVAVIAVVAILVVGKRLKSN